MSIHLRTHAKNKSVLISGISTIALAGYRYLDLWGNLSFLVEKLQDGTVKSTLGLFASERGANVLFFVAIAFLVLSLLFEVRRAKQGEAQEGQWHETAAYDLTPRVEGRADAQAQPASNQVKAVEDTIRAATSKLVCLRARIIDSEADSEPSIIYETRDAKSETSIKAAIAEFRNEIVPRSSPSDITYLRANLTYYDDDGEFRHIVNRAFWLLEQDHYIDLDAGETASLVLAFGVDKGFAFAVENYQNDPVRGTRLEPIQLTAERLRVHAQLVGGRRNELIYEFQFLLRLDETPTVEVISPKSKLTILDGSRKQKPDRLEIARKLNGFIEEGNTLLRQSAGTASPSSQKALWWETIVKTYIEETFGEFDALEWSKAYPMTPYPGSAVNRNLVNRLYTLLQRLGEMIAMLKKD